MNKLISARKKKGLTQEEAAKSIGISYSMLTKLERGFRGASDKTKIKIAKFYNSSVQEIFFEKTTTKSEENIMELNKQEVS